MINEPIDTDGEIAYKIPRFEKSLLTWSHTSNTLLSGDRCFGGVVGLYLTARIGGETFLVTKYIIHTRRQFQTWIFRYTWKRNGGSETFRQSSWNRISYNINQYYIW